MSEKLRAEWFWADRWATSNAFLLPLEARGLFREMLTAAWVREARLPNCPVAVQRAAGVTSEEWDRAWPLVEKYWEVEDGYLVNPQQREIYAETISRSEEATERAKAAAAARWEKHRAKKAAAKAKKAPEPPAPEEADAPAMRPRMHAHMPEHCPPSPSPGETPTESPPRSPPAAAGGTHRPERRLARSRLGGLTPEQEAGTGHLVAHWAAHHGRSGTRYPVTDPIRTAVQRALGAGYGFADLEAAVTNAASDPWITGRGKRDLPYLIRVGRDRYGNPCDHVQKFRDYAPPEPEDGRSKAKRFTDQAIDRVMARLAGGRHDSGRREAGDGDRSLPGDGVSAAVG